MVASDFHSIVFHNMEVNGYRQQLGVQQTKETHTSLERFEGE